MMDKEDCLKAFKLMTIGMIEKDVNKLKTSLSIDAHLTHMTGKVESREEYISDILDGTLNYYDYEIIEFNENKAIIKLLAKVYGGSKSWWKLSMEMAYTKEEGIIKIKECRVRLG